MTHTRISYEAVISAFLQASEERDLTGLPVARDGWGGFCELKGNSFSLSQALQVIKLYLSVQTGGGKKRSRLVTSVGLKELQECLLPLCPNILFLDLFRFIPMASGTSEQIKELMSGKRQGRRPLSSVL